MSLCKCRCFYFNDETDTCPLDIALPFSTVLVANSFSIERPVAAFSHLPPINALSEFEDEHS